MLFGCRRNGVKEQRESCSAALGTPFRSSGNGTGEQRKDRSSSSSQHIHTLANRMFPHGWTPTVTLVMGSTDRSITTLNQGREHPRQGGWVLPVKQRPEGRTCLINSRSHQPAIRSGLPGDAWGLGYKPPTWASLSPFTQGDTLRHMIS